MYGRTAISGRRTSLLAGISVRASIELICLANDRMMPQPFTAAVFMAFRRVRCPGDGQLGSDSVGALRFEKSDEFGQTRFVFAQLISKRPAKIDILTDIFSQDLSSRTSRPRLSEVAQCTKVDLRVNPCGVRLPVTQALHRFHLKTLPGQASRSPTYGERDNRLSVSETMSALFRARVDGLYDCAPAATSPVIGAR